MRRGDRVALVRCSNPQPSQNRDRFKVLAETLRRLGLEPVETPFLYGGGARERAEALMDCYRDESIRALFDISGGDMANEVLPYLDYDIIRENQKPFWGYSDLTTVINAIYAKTGAPSMLYQARNLLGWTMKGNLDGETARLQQNRMEHFLAGDEAALTGFPYRMVRGTAMKGTVVGGNIRCLLKLAGTPYWPDLRGNILLLEAHGGKEPQMRTYLSQLKQLGAFQQAAGILLGTFTVLEEEGKGLSMEDLVLEYADGGSLETEGSSPLRKDIHAHPKTDGILPIAKTCHIGHSAAAMGIWIGRELELSAAPCHSC